MRLARAIPSPARTVPGLRRIRNVWSAAELQAKNERDRVGLRKCIRPLMEGSPPGQDGMRYALFPFS